MTTKVVPLVLGLFLFGCARKPPNPILEELIDVTPIRQKFEGIYGDDVFVYVGFGKTGEATARALCNRQSDFAPSIVVKRWKWDLMSATSHESILMHEFGHCFVRRGDIEWEGNGCPDSLMASPLLSDRCYRKREKYYLDELVN